MNTSAVRLDVALSLQAFRTFRDIGPESDVYQMAQQALKELPADVRALIDHPDEPVLALSTLDGYILLILKAYTTPEDMVTVTDEDQLEIAIDQRETYAEPIIRALENTGPFTSRFFTEMAHRTRVHLEPQAPHWLGRVIGAMYREGEVDALTDEDTHHAPSPGRTTAAAA